ncbi:tRNA (N(6)-L-threonylcarbamoyladenosine(37)-C(2))-methylthiotransferase MtaB [Spirochaeta isovalerica]|uniref:Threonylcarbamoyladenosine tRNA methylthiotransferase MtaB n=1 Tax=Spirochaeta isovalerica TaxID=150 RepID=A0A841RCA1_9SPIO|nr:threonylcarbamoyladenosine tRNA methylthiotransferase MtaB [Spirochaeta isovalerica]
MKAAFYTLGCKLNQVETEALVSAFREQGVSIVSSDNQADIYVVNTCTVTSKSEQKARRMIRKFSRDNNSSLVIATGCYVQMEEEEVLSLGDNVVTVSLDDKDTILDLAAFIGSYRFDLRELKSRTALWLQEHLATSKPDGGERFRYSPADFNFHSRAFLKIQDGCDNSCAYCRVTIARGASVSLDSDEIINRLNQLAGKGYREVVLTGINIDSYQSGDLDLAGLLKKILEETRGFRIRLSSLEPDTLTEQMCGVLADERICPHFHLSVQSGSDVILKAMRRNYTSETIREAVRQLRVVKDDPFIAADIIAGFPGETESDLEESMKIITELNFARAHVFPFSPRPGTEAYDITPKVPERETVLRAARLRKASEESYKSYISRSIGKEAVILLEHCDDNGLWYGFSETYIRFAVENVDKGAQAGQMAVCKIKDLSAGTGSAVFHKFQ